MRGTATGKKATSEAMALEIVVDAGGSRQLVEIGSANARIGAPTPAGVFRAGGTALDLQALQSALHFGNVQHKSIPCEGTLGRTMTYQVPTAGVLGGLVARVNGVTYAHRGSQNARKDLAKGFSGGPDRQHLRSPRSASRSTTSSARSRCAARRTSRSGRRSPRASARSPTRASPSPYPAVGQTVELPGGAGLVQRQLVKNSRYGAKSIGLRVQLFAEAVVLDLAPRRRAHLPALTQPEGQQPFRVASRRAASPSRRAWATSGKTTLWPAAVPIRPRITQVVILPGSTWATAWASS